jgi:phospholipid N-methyltransferase
MKSSSSIPSNPVKRMKKIDFLRQSLKTMRTTGSITPSSRFLVRQMMRPVEFSSARIIVELGAGEGVLTRELLAHMPSNCKLISFEINADFCNTLRATLLDSRFVLVEDSAEYLEKYLKENGFSNADFIISALPFVALPEELSQSIIQACYKNLKENGLFVQFHYSSFMKKIYRRVFGNVDVTFVPLNIPPAFVMVSKK